MTDSVERCIASFTARYDVINPQVEGVVDRVSAINKHVSRVFEETLARHGLTHPDYKLLLQLATAEQAVSAGDLARALMLSSGGMTARLDRLEKAGLVRRVADARDRRSVLVEMTDDGRRSIDGAVAEQAGKEIDVLSALSPRELASLNGLLRKVLTSLESRTDLSERRTAVSA